MVRSSLSGQCFAGIFVVGAGSHSVLNNEVIGATFRTPNGPSQCHTGPVGHGIFVGAPSSNNVIEGNSLSGNPGAGLLIVLGSTGNQVVCNQALGNLIFDDIFDNNAPGVNLYDINLCEVSRVGVPGPAINICGVPDISGHQNPL